MGSWYAVVHPDDAERYVDQVLLCMQTEAPLRIDYRIVAKDGRTVWIDEAATYEQARGSSPGRWRGALFDVTERKAAETELLDSRARLRMLNKLGALLRPGSSIEEAINGALQELVREFPGCGVSYSTIDDQSVLEARRVIDPLGSQAPVGVRVDLSAAPEYVASLRAGRPFVTEDARSEPQVAGLADVIARSGRVATLAVPLRHSERLVGLLAMSLPEVHRWTDHEVTSIVEVAELMSVAIAESHSAEQLRASQSDRRALLERLVAVQEDERLRIARELHDSLGQTLTSLSMFTKELEEEVGSEHGARMLEFRNLIRSAVSETRALVTSLRPAELDSQGLSPSLRQLAERTLAEHGIAVDLLDSLGTSARLPAALETAVYRIVQEALTNVVRHADAGSVSLVLGVTDGWLSVVVEDDGRGIDPAAGAEHGLGIVGMRERAELVGGTVRVESSAGGGTIVRLRAPVP